MDVAVLRRPVTSGEDVRDKQYLFVGQPFRHLDRADIGERHPHILRLPTLVAAIQVRVAIDSTDRIAIDGFHQPGLRVRVIARRPQTLLTEEAAAAGDRERHHYAVASLEVLYCRSDFDYLAHELVAEDIPLHHRRNKATVEMQVGTADGHQTGLHDAIAGIGDL